LPFLYFSPLSSAPSPFTVSSCAFTRGFSKLCWLLYLKSQTMWISWALVEFGGTR
jgi:hypothetical protein